MPRYIKDMLAVLGVVAALVIGVLVISQEAYHRGLATGKKQALAFQQDKDTLNRVCTAWWFSPRNRLDKRK